VGEGGSMCPNGAWATIDNFGDKNVQNTK